MTRRNAFALLTGIPWLGLGGLLTGLAACGHTYDPSGVALLYLVVTFGPLLGIWMEYDNQHPEEVPDPSHRKR